VVDGVVDGAVGVVVGVASTPVRLGREVPVSATAALLGSDVPDDRAALRPIRNQTTPMSIRTATATNSNRRAQ
jgi:hypothetical protein